jgi:NodT family efflux transporter outer membrane factor (OMF) lipoprotein
LQNDVIKYSSKKIRSGTITFLCSCVVACLSGCSPKVAKVDLPYDTLQAFSLSGQEESSAKWWLAFQDPELNALIDSALRTNLSLKNIWHRLEEAGALVGIASSAQWPQISLGLQSGLSVPEPDFVGGENTQLSLRAGYEVDLWGRIRYSVHANEYRLKASYYDYRTAAVSLSGETALTYFRLKATNHQLRLIDEQLQTNEQVLALIRARFASGQVRGVDILRQQQLIENTKEQMIELEMQSTVLKNQLAILLSTPPGAEFRRTFNVSDTLPGLPPMPQTGVPLQLINRRPDVLSAFNQLQASDRELAAAISNKYPRLNFSITSAVRSNTLEGLLKSQAGSLTGSLLAPLFYGRRLKAEVDRAEAVRRQVASTYGEIVLTAFQEVENNLIQEVKLKEQIEVMDEQLRLADESLGQLRIEYLNGSVPYLDVLSTLTQQQQLRRDFVDTRMALLEIRIGLYRALAGGFDTTHER